MLRTSGLKEFEYHSRKNYFPQNLRVDDTEFTDTHEIIHQEKNKKFANDLVSLKRIYCSWQSKRDFT